MKLGPVTRGIAFFSEHPDLKSHILDLIYLFESSKFEAVYNSGSMIRKQLGLSMKVDEYIKASDTQKPFHKIHAFKEDFFSKAQTICSFVIATDAINIKDEAVFESFKKTISTLNIQF